MKASTWVQLVLAVLLFIFAGMGAVFAVHELARLIYVVLITASVTWFYGRITASKRSHRSV